jgi:anaerobic magnesium-protoporphyrin IX monomethyl ester cyclase
MKALLISEALKHRSFNGANKAPSVLASCLNNAGFKSVVQLDLERRDIDFSDVLAEATDADLIAFAGCLTPQWPEIDEHAQMLSSHLERAGRSTTPILVGGYAAKSVQDISALTPWIAGYFNGEGEEAIVTIAQAVAAGKFYEERSRIPGLCYQADGQFHYSIAPRTKNLDSVDQNLGFVHVPEIHNMDIFVTKSGRQLKTAQIYTQRGCPWVCGYCNKSTEGNMVVRLGEEAFREQLGKLRRAGYEAIYLDVDTFTVNESAARREAAILFEEGFVWGSNTRVDRIDFDMLAHFHSMGCIYMFFGVEHILPEVLLAIGKFNGSLRQQLAQAEQYKQTVKTTFRDMGRLGFPSSYFLILGLPKAKFDLTQTSFVGFEPTTFEDDLAAVRFGLESCDPDFLNFNLLRFMPGTSAADVSSHAAYSCVRPSGRGPITAGYFLPRVVEAFNYCVSPYHGVYRLCESVGANQPTTTAVDAQRVYDTVKASIGLLNKKIEAGGKPTRLFLDSEILSNKLVTRDEQGCYTIAPLNEFEKLDD